MMLKNILIILAAAAFGMWQQSVMAAVAMSLTLSAIELFTRREA